MVRRSRANPPDEAVQRILDALGAYEEAHPRADIEAYRHNAVSVRIRVIDPDFGGMDRVERDEAIWRILERLPPEVQSQITLLLLLTPDETSGSFANLEFENPVPSHL